MSLSSFCVVTNALRLNFVNIYDARKDKKKKQKNKIINKIVSDKVPNNVEKMF